MLWQSLICLKIPPFDTLQFHLKLLSFTFYYKILGVFVCRFIWGHISMCLCQWRSKDSRECHSSGAVHISLPGQELFHGSRTHQVGQATWPARPGDPPVSTYQELGLQCSLPCQLIFMWVLGAQHKSLCFQGKHFTIWVVSLFPTSYFIYSCAHLCMCECFVFVFGPYLFPNMLQEATYIPTI